MIKCDETLKFLAKEHHRIRFVFPIDGSHKFHPYRGHTFFLLVIILIFMSTTNKKQIITSFYTKNYINLIHCHLHINSKIYLGKHLSLLSQPVLNLSTITILLLLILVDTHVAMCLVNILLVFVVGFHQDITH